MKKPSPPWFILIVIFLLGIIISTIIYYYNKDYYTSLSLYIKNTKASSKIEIPALPTSTFKPSPTILPKDNIEIIIIEPSPTPTTNNDSLEKELIKYFDLKTTNNLIVSQQSETHAQGELKQKWWLAFNDKSNGWQIIATGNNYIDCADISEYNFSAQMVPVCWNYASNQFITR